jgi:lysophospholipase L1-like esterase
MRIMGSEIRAPYDIEKAALEIARKKPRFNDTVPERFINYLNDYRERRNTRSKDGTGKRNPLIVALGDSVTQGCFEGNLNYSQQMMDEFYPGGERIPNVIDTVNVYHEKFRCILAEKYNAPVSVINSGIGGDTVIHMLNRLERDVLSYSPHLVLVNASLNGPAGDLETYGKHFRAIVDGILENTEAEIILITPNMMTKSWMRDLESRVNIIREVAVEKRLCIADAYAVWKDIEAAGIDIGTLLSNRINHPVTVGHEIFTIELMKLFE